jgi:membrane-associated protein
MDLHFDLKSLIEAVGYVGLFAIVFAESGLFFGFFLPGDSLLFTAGFLASQGLFELPVLIVLLSIAAITGDSVGYWCGEKFGRKLFTREDSIWFHKKHLITAHEFYERHGGKAIILARFLPAVRTFVPIVAGMGRMSYRKFLFYNVFGGLFWVISMTVGGYFLTDAIRRLFGISEKDIDKVLIPVVLVIIVVSGLPTMIHLYKENRQTINAWVRARLSRSATV